MSVLLDEYIRLEQEMLRLDEIEGGESEADEIRDFMDAVWRRLSARERERLNHRAVVAPLSRPRLSLIVGPDFVSVPQPARAPEHAQARQVTVSESEIWSDA